MSVLIANDRATRWATQDGCVKCQARMAEIESQGLEGQELMHALSGMHVKCGDPGHLLPFDDSKQESGSVFIPTDRSGIGPNVVRDRLEHMFKEATVRHPSVVGPSWLRCPKAVS